MGIDTFKSLFFRFPYCFLSFNFEISKFGGLGSQEDYSKGLIRLKNDTTVLNNAIEPKSHAMLSM